MIIGKNHPDIKGQGSMTVTVKPYYMYFSTAAVRNLGLKVGKYLLFDVTGSNWLFYVTDDNSGFPITSDGGVKQGIKINSSGLIRMFQKTTGHKLPASFYLQRTNAEVNGHPVAEILTAKPIDKLGKT